MKRLSFNVGDELYDDLRQVSLAGEDLEVLLVNYLTVHVRKLLRTRQEDALEELVTSEHETLRKEVYA